MATYIESQTGSQITDLSKVDPNKFYVQLGGGGEQISGSTLLPVPAPQNQGNQAITGADLTQAQGLNLPADNQPKETDYLAALNSLVTQNLNPETSPEEQQGTDISKSLLDIQQQLTGQTAAQIKAEETAGLPAYQKQLTDVNSQIQALQKEALSIPLQLLEEATGRGITAGGLQPIQTGLLRQNAIKALSLSAIAQTLQGNVAMAQQQANRAVELEFAPMEAQLEYLKIAYQINRDQLERRDKKRADLLNFALGERERVLKERKETKQFILDMKMQAAKFGADATTLQLFDKAETEGQALNLAGRYLGEDFRQKVVQQKFENDLQTLQYNLSLRKFNEDVRQFGEQQALEKYKLGLAQVNAKIKSAEDMGALNFANQEKQDLLQSKVNLIDTLINSPGLKGSVGPYKISRFTPFDFDKAARQEFAGGVHQLLQQETIDTLINLKAKGGTLGALSDQERILLQEAATKIGNWEIKDKNNNGTGRYAVSETAFRTELNRIKTLALKAISKMQGTNISNETQELRNAGYTEEQIQIILNAQ